MSLYSQWFNSAYNKSGQSEKKYWDEYLPIEQKVYENMLKQKQNTISGVFSEVAESLKMTNIHFLGFLEGINGALSEPVDVENITPDSHINVSFEFENLLKKMVEYKAEHLYNLEQWDNIYTKEELKNIILTEKKSKTVTKPEKIGRNSVCPCGSGKKFKKCCGA